MYLPLEATYVKHRFFHVDMDRVQAEEILSKRGSVPGDFVFRFSSTPGMLTISYLQSNKEIKHVFLQGVSLKNQFKYVCFDQEYTSFYGIVQAQSFLQRPVTKPPYPISLEDLSTYSNSDNELEREIAALETPKWLEIEDPTFLELTTDILVTLCNNAAYQDIIGDNNGMELLISLLDSERSGILKVQQNSEKLVELFQNNAKLKNSMKIKIPQIKTSLSKRLNACISDSPMVRPKKRKPRYGSIPELEPTSATKKAPVSYGFVPPLSDSDPSLELSEEKRDNLGKKKQYDVFPGFEDK